MRFYPWYRFSFFKLNEIVNSLNDYENNPCQSLVLFIHTQFNILKRKQGDDISHDLIEKIIWIQTHHCNDNFDWMTLLGLIRPEVLQTLVDPFLQNWKNEEERRQ